MTRSTHLDRDCCRHENFGRGGGKLGINEPRDVVVALGDSSASGEGAGDYAPSSDNNGGTCFAQNGCHQSANAWIRKTVLPGSVASIGQLADSADAALDFHFVACSGAQTEHLLPCHTANSPVPLNAEDEDGRFGQGGMVSQLLSGDDSAIVDESAARLTGELPFSLITVFQEIRERARNARIAVFGYPELFETGTACLPIAEVNRDWLSELTQGVNAIIQGPLR